MAAPMARVGTRLEMPFLMLCGMGLSAFMAGLGAVVYTLILVVAALGNGPYTVNGESVDRTTFFSSMGPFFLAYPLALAAFGIVAYAFWRERPWGRAIVMAFWLALFLATLLVQLMEPQPTGDFLSGLLVLLFCWAIAAWYFYSKSSVVAYYKAVEAKFRSTNATGTDTVTEGT